MKNLLDKLILKIALWCDKHLEWHHCKQFYSDGFNNHGTCIYCGARCIQDSQGNWFKVGEFDD